MVFLSELTFFCVLFLAESTAMFEVTSDRDESLDVEVSETQLNPSSHPIQIINI